MVTTDPWILATELSLHPLVERQLRARSQNEAHDRARAITREMEAEGQVIIARSWVSSARGGTVTLVFTPRAAGTDTSDSPPSAQRLHVRATDGGRTLGIAASLVPVRQRTRP